PRGRKRVRARAARSSGSARRRPRGRDESGSAGPPPGRGLMSIISIAAKRWRGKSRVSLTEREFVELAEQAAQEQVVDEVARRVDVLRDFLTREGARRAVRALLEARAFEPEAEVAVRTW